MGRLIIGGVLGGVVLYAWGFLSWAVIPWHENVITKMPGEDQVMRAMRSGVEETGVYMFPHHGSPTGAADLPEEELERYKAKARAGPFGLVFFVKEGFEMDDSSAFFKNGALVFLMALLASALLSAASERLLLYPMRVLFVIGVGMVGALGSYLSMWVWFSVPTDYTLVMAADLVVGWFLAGIVLAGVIRPQIGNGA